MRTIVIIYIGGTHKYIDEIHSSHFIMRMNFCYDCVIYTTRTLYSEKETKNKVLKLKLFPLKDFRFQMGDSREGERGLLLVRREKKTEVQSAFKNFLQYRIHRACILILLIGLLFILF